jgi:hypothetical protein
MRITVLVDNAGNPGLRTEHGLSLWIEARGRRILFDTGQGNALRHNARRLRVPLGKRTRSFSATATMTMRAGWPESWKSPPPRG